MTEYVLIHAKVEWHEPMVLLVLKERPSWQKGRLNLVGGKVEEGETPQQAALRELKEESGFEAGTVSKLGEIIGVDCIVHCFSAFVDKVDPQPRDEEDELVAWYSWEKVKHDYRLMPNLRIIIPLLEMQSSGWRITDQQSSVDVDWHSISVDLLIEKPFVNG
jgi:8-oxo-dGTP pyrophosphatase MutT (NUDIX family)